MTNIYNVQKTQEQIKQDEVLSQTEYRKNTLINLASSIVQSYNSFWYNPILSAQEQCDILGTSALSLFSEHAICVQFILERIPNITDFVPDFMSVTAIPTDKEIAVVNGLVKINDKVITQ